MKTLASFVALLCKNGFIVLGSWWTVVEICQNQQITVPKFIITPWAVLYIALGITALYFIYPLFRVIHLHSRDCELCIRPGNILWKKNGSVVVGVNDELACNPAAIGENSIHSQLLQKKYKEEIKKVFNDQREGAAGGKAEYGVTFTVDVPSQKRHFIFLVMSSLPHPQIIITSPQKLCGAITQLFENEGTYHVKRQKLYIPIIGTGSAGVELTRNEVINMIACAYCSRETGDNHQIKRLTILVCWRDYFAMNIRNTVKDLEWIAHNCCCLKEDCSR